MAVFPEKVACGKLLSVFSYIYYKSLCYNKKNTYLFIFNITTSQNKHYYYTKNNS